MRNNKNSGQKIRLHKYLDLVFFLPGTDCSSLGDWYPTFRDYIKVSSSQFEMPNKNVGHHHPVKRRHILEGRKTPTAQLRTPKYQKILNNCICVTCPKKYTQKKVPVILRKGIFVRRIF